MMGGGGGAHGPTQGQRSDTLPARLQEVAGGTHGYLEDLLTVVQHLDPDGHLPPRGLRWGALPRLQGGHSEALGGAEPLSGRGRSVGGVHVSLLSSAGEKESGLIEKHPPVAAPPSGVVGFFTLWRFPSFVLETFSRAVTSTISLRVQTDRFPDSPPGTAAHRWGFQTRPDVPHNKRMQQRRLNSSQRPFPTSKPQTVKECGLFLCIHSNPRRCKHAGRSTPNGWRTSEALFTAGFIYRV